MNFELIRYARCYFAAELLPSAIRVNDVRSGYVPTDNVVHGDAS